MPALQEEFVIAREAEVVYFCNKMWPMNGTDHEFMDSNHTIERSVR